MLQEERAKGKGVKNSVEIKRSEEDNTKVEESGRQKEEKGNDTEKEK